MNLPFKKNLQRMRLRAAADRTRGAGAFPVLMYHSVADDNDIFFTVKTAEFARQMQYLADEDFAVISLQTLLQKYLQPQKSVPTKTVVLTFDDGFADNFTNVFPVLQRHNFSATIFPVTSLIGRPIPNSQGAPIAGLDLDQIKKMHASGLIDFQAHTHRHLKKWLEQNEDEMLEDIKKSRDWLEQNLDKKCEIFAYPSGRCDERAIQILQKLNFKIAVTTKFGHNEMKNLQPLKMNRYSIDSAVNFPTFKKIL